jgi:hypothetical protein
MEHSAPSRKKVGIKKASIEKVAKKLAKKKASRKGRACRWRRWWRRVSRLS